MKLLSFIQNGQTRVGALNEKGGVVDVTALGCPDTMNGVIAGGAPLLGAHRRPARGRGPPDAGFYVADAGQCDGAPEDRLRGPQL